MSPLCVQSIVETVSTFNKFYSSAGIFRLLFHHSVFHPVIISLCGGSVLRLGNVKGSS